MKALPKHTTQAISELISGSGMAKVFPAGNERDFAAVVKSASITAKARLEMVKRLSALDDLVNFYLLMDALCFTKFEFNSAASNAGAYLQNTSIDITLLTKRGGATYIDGVFDDILGETSSSRQGDITVNIFSLCDVEQLAILLDDGPYTLDELKAKVIQEIDRQVLCDGHLDF